MNINEVVTCAYMMRASAEHLHYVAKRLEESNLADYHRAGAMSAACSNAYQAFRLAGVRYLGEDIFDQRVEAISREVEPLEIY
jgi:hypothetical protein